MFSLEDLAALKTAIELCNNSELKMEILWEPGSDSEFSEYIKIVKNKAETILEKLGLIEKLKKKVRGYVLLIGWRMLIWAKYHERSVDLSHEYSIKFLNSSFFASHGITDNKKAAEELVKSESLNITQKYKLACLYYLKEHIPDLYSQMSLENKEEFYDDQRINQPEILVKLPDGPNR